MNLLLRNFLLLVVFFISLELAFQFKYFYDETFYTSNNIHPSEKYLSLWSKMSDKANSKDIKQRLFLIGDSFFDAEEFGGQESYVPFFSKWLSKKGWEFYNLSLQGTSINDHQLIWKQICDQNYNTYVFSIKVHDINKLAFFPIENSNDSNNKKNSIDLTLKNFLKKSDVIFLVKDALHQVYMWLKHIPAPYTHLNQVLLNPSEKSLQKLSKFLSDLDKRKGKVIVLINYPYNFKYDTEKLENLSLFRYFKSLTFENLTLLQSPLIVNEKGSSGWRNVHPNSNSMKKVFHYIKKDILNHSDLTFIKKQKVFTSSQ